MDFQKIDSSWRSYLLPEFEKPYMNELRDFLNQELQKGYLLYPPPELVFNALQITGLDALKVLILGQDPYINPGQAMGLSFSVPENTGFPPSLANIFKELVADIGCPYPTNGDLTPWAKQGCLLLNSVLSVRPHQSNSHANKGWEQFTDHIIHVVSQEKENVVFILWGAYAQKKTRLIDQTKHLVIQSPHPSPLSSYRGFFGSKPFSKTNAYLKSHGQDMINWCL